MDNTNRNLIIGVVLLIVLGVIGFMIAGSREGQNPLVIPSPGQVQPQSTSLPVDSQTSLMTLNEQNNSAQSGIAKLNEEDGKVKATIDISGFPENVLQPAHIHAGTCASLGAIIYALNDVENGKSETVIDTTIDRLKSQQPLSINVHKSESDFNTFVSCGDLIL